MTEKFLLFKFCLGFLNNAVVNACVSLKNVLFKIEILNWKEASLIKNTIGKRVPLVDSFKNDSLSTTMKISTSQYDESGLCIMSLYFQATKSEWNF